MTKPKLRKQSKLPIINRFYVDGLMDTQIIIKKWKFDWKFPFIHRTITTYTLIEWQSLINMELNQRMNDALFASKQKK